MKVDFTDDVSGVVVGGNYGQAFLSYEGRQQGNTFYPVNKDEMVKMLSDKLSEIKAECGVVFDIIYPNKDGWKFNYNGI